MIFNVQITMCDINGIFIVDVLCGTFHNSNGMVTGNGMAIFIFVHLLTIRFDQLLSIYGLAADLADSDVFTFPACFPVTSHLPMVLPHTYCGC